MRFLAIMLLLLVAVIDAQVLGMKRITIGKLDGFYRDCRVEVTAEIESRDGKTSDRSISVVVKCENPYNVGIAILTLPELREASKALQLMLHESEKSHDYLQYSRRQANLTVTITGGDESHVGLMAQDIHAVTVGRSQSENRKILSNFIELLKKGQAALASKQ